MSLRAYFPTREIPASSLRSEPIGIGVCTLSRYLAGRDPAGPGFSPLLCRLTFWLCAQPRPGLSSLLSTSGSRDKGYIESWSHRVGSVYTSSRLPDYFVLPNLAPLLKPQRPRSSVFLCPCSLQFVSNAPERKICEVTHPQRGEGKKISSAYPARVHGSGRCRPAEPSHAPSNPNLILPSLFIGPTSVLPL